MRGEILSYSRFVDDVVPGNPLHYATALLCDGLATGVVIEAREGRPIKVEGNPDHPSSRGATSPFEQAALLSLYDPDRARTARFRGEPRGTRAFFEWMIERAPNLALRK
jgi:molybdopterin-containing oxidoreductase family iron-sulfur binding subunit